MWTMAAMMTKGDTAIVTKKSRIPKSMLESAHMMSLLSLFVGPRAT